MNQWWEQYIDSKSMEGIILLFKQQGLENEKFNRWVFENAALCRLAFSSLNMESRKPGFTEVPKEAIISQTKVGMGKGRPETAKWAFWISYIIRQKINIKGKQATSNFLGEFTGILLNRIVSDVEARTKFSGIRKAIETHAEGAARFLLVNVLKEKLSDQRFREYTFSTFKDVLKENTQMWPMVENGKIRDEWLENTVRVRASILKRAQKNGPLAGQLPEINILSATKLIQGLPLNKLSSIAVDQPGKVHLEKNKDVDLPQPLLEQEEISIIGEVLLSHSRIGKENKTALRFPEDALNIRQPYASAIVSMPNWWREWHMTHID